MSTQSYTSLKSCLTEWTVFEDAASQLAHVLGLGNTHLARYVVNSWNPIGNILYGMLDSMSKIGILQSRQEPDFEYRWNPEFEGEQDADTGNQSIYPDQQLPPTMNPCRELRLKNPNPHVLGWLLSRLAGGLDSVVEIWAFICLSGGPVDPAKFINDHSESFVAHAIVLIAALGMAAHHEPLRGWCDELERSCRQIRELFLVLATFKKPIRNDKEIKSAINSLQSQYYATRTCLKNIADHMHVSVSYWDRIKSRAYQDQLMEFLRQSFTSSGGVDQ